MAKKKVRARKFGAPGHRPQNHTDKTSSSTTKTTMFTTSAPCDADLTSRRPLTSIFCTVLQLGVWVRIIDLTHTVSAPPQPLSVVVLLVEYRPPHPYYPMSA
eukprot:scaffold20629_cov66-Skeletonema_dohrnii-CCMP3373.AAC.2